MRNDDCDHGLGQVAELRLALSGTPNTMNVTNTTGLAKLTIG